MAASIPAILSLLSSLGPSFMGNSQDDGAEGYNQVSTFNPQQKQLFNQSIQGFGGIQPQIMEYLQQLLSGDSGATEAFAAPYKRQFEQETVPKLAERFAGLGALSSSGFQQSLGQAGAGLSENLASLREGQRSQAISPIMQMIQSLLGQNTKAFVPKQPGGFQSFITAAAPGIGKGVSQFALSKFLK